MQSCWIGDIADFAKYGLLKRLCETDLRLGVVWYLTANSNKRPMTSYLKATTPNAYTACDEALFEALRGIVGSKGENSLTVQDVAVRGVLPPGTRFFDTPLAFGGLNVNDLGARAQRRGKWFEAALAATADTDLVFLDPDSGIESGSVQRTNDRGTLYAYLDDIRTFVARGQSVVLVQFGRPQGFEAEPLLARERLATLCASVSGACETPFGLSWVGGHKVSLIVVPAKVHAARLADRAERTLAHAGWARFVHRL